MVGKRVTSTHPMFKCSNILQTGALVKRKTAGGVGTHISTKKTDIRRIWIQNKMPVQIQTSTLEFNQEEVAALSHHRPQVCAVHDHALYCNPPLCAVGDHVLPESKKEQVKEPPEAT